MCDLPRTVSAFGMPVGLMVEQQLRVGGAAFGSSVRASRNWPERVISERSFLPGSEDWRCDHDVCLDSRRRVGSPRFCRWKKTTA